MGRGEQSEREREGWRQQVEPHERACCPYGYVQNISLICEECDLSTGAERKGRARGNEEMEGQNALCAQLMPSTLDGSVAGLSGLDVDCTQKHHTSHRRGKEA